MEGGDPPGVVSRGEATRGDLCPVLESSEKKGKGELERVHRRARRMLRCVEHVSSEETVRELGVCSVEGRRLMGVDLLNAFKSVKGGWQEGDAKLF